MSHSDFGDLARSAGHWILMAADASGRVIHGSQSVRDILVLFEALLIERKAVARRLSDAVADTVRAVKAGSGETGWCWGRRLLGDSGDHCHQESRKAHEKGKLSILHWIGLLSNPKSWVRSPRVWGCRLVWRLFS